MRKRISLRLCVLLAMVFALCIVMSACESDGTNTPSDTTEPTLSGDTPHSDTNETSKRAFYSENGAMYTEDYVFYFRDGFVRYFDAESRSGIVYCFHPECEHKPAYRDAQSGEIVYTCPANSIGDQGIVLRKEGVYYLSNPVVPTLMYADLKLENRREVSMAENPCGTVLFYLYTEKDYFVAYIDVNEYIRRESDSGEAEWIIGEPLEEKIVGVYRMSLDGKTQESVFQSAGNYNNVINDLYEYRGHVYFTHIYWDVPLSELPSPYDDYSRYENEMAKHKHACIYDYDVEHGSLNCVLSEESGNYNYSFFDGYILRWTTEESPAILYRMNGDCIRELEGDVLDGVRSDGGMILHYTENDSPCYRMYDPEKDSVLREVVLTGKVLLRVAVGDSYYVYVPNGNSLAMAYISAEDFWNGDIDKATVLP